MRSSIQTKPLTNTNPNDNNKCLTLGLAGWTKCSLDLMQYWKWVMLCNTELWTWGMLGNTEHRVTLIVPDTFQFDQSDQTEI